MERLWHCVIDHGSSSWLQCEVAKYSYTFGDPKYQSAPVIVPPMVQGHWVFETIVFFCFSTCVLWPLKTAMWVLWLIKVCKPRGVQLHFQVSQLKGVFSNQLIKWSCSDTPTVQLFGVYSINPKYTLFVCFLEYNRKYQKPGSWLSCSGALYSHCS